MDASRGAGAVLSDIRTVAQTGSTNADLLALARSGSSEGTWLRAERQTAGRGRLGRSWESPGGNLYASTLVRSRPTDPCLATLALVAAVALEESVAIYLTLGDARTMKLALKWPNDLLLDGAKLSGILLERIDDAVVIGFGINLASHPALKDRPTTSLAAHGISVPPERFVETLAETFARWVGRWRGEGLAVVRDRWLDRAHPLGIALRVRLPDDTSLNGLFDGLDAGGALILRLAGGERHVIHAGDVFAL